MEVEQMGLRGIRFSNKQWEQREIAFKEAKLMLVTEYGDKFWYVEVDGVPDRELLEWFASSEDIRIDLTVVSDNGEKLQGIAYAHPNTAHGSLAIRGDGELKRL